MKFHITAKYPITNKVENHSVVRDGIQVRVAPLVSGGIVLDVSFDAGHTAALKDGLCNALVEFVNEGKALNIFGDVVCDERAVLLAKATLSLSVNGHNVTLKNPLGSAFVVSGDLPSFAGHILVAAEKVMSRVESSAACNVE